MRERYLRSTACRVALLAAGMSVGGIGSVASAQTGGQGVTQGDEIVVVGIRRSLADAIEAKREMMTISDTISAEDIGRFPDQNLAESLQRITGVQITRSWGEGSKISVRGLPPDFTRTQYNGRTLTTPDGTRSFDFTSLTSDFVSAVEVYKSPTADMIDGGLSATVNVRTNRPLDVGRDHYAFTAEGIYEDIPNKITPHVAGFVNKVFADGTVGVNFGVNYERRRILNPYYLAYGTETADEGAKNPPLDYNLDGDFNDRYAFNHAAGLGTIDGYNRRLTFIGGIQVKPSDTVELYVDGLYSNYRWSYKGAGSELRFTNIGGPGARIVDSVIEDGLLTYLDADGVDLTGYNRVNRQNDRTFSGAVGGKFDFGRLKATSEFTYSRSRRQHSLYELATIARASASEDLRPDRDGLALVAFHRGFDPLDPTNFIARSFSGRVKSPTTDRNWDGRVDLTYEAGEGFVNAIRVGAIRSDRRNDYRSNNFSLGAEALANALGVAYNPGIENGSFNAGNYMMVYNVKNGMRNYDGDGGVPTSYLIPDYDKLFAQIPLDDLIGMARKIDTRPNDFTVRERVWAAYVRADFASADERLSGNIGVRYVRTSQVSSGFAPDISKIVYDQNDVATELPGAEAVSIRNRYSNWLPSLNVKYNATPNLVARLALARVLTRPTLSMLSPSTSVNANVRSITQNNPNLRPYLADQADISLEYYFGRNGLISIAGFYKDLKNFIVNTSDERNITLQAVGGGTVTLPFRFNMPGNGSNGKLKGVEMGVQLPFTFLPAGLDGLGIVANYTYIDAGKIRTVKGGPLRDMVGVSKNSYNLAGYYEKYGFGLRVSYNYRSGWVADHDSYFGDGAYRAGYGQLDASMNYDFNEHITLNIDATNLTNTPLEGDNNIGVGNFYREAGRRFTAGVRVKL